MIPSQLRSGSVGSQSFDSKFYFGDNFLIISLELKDQPSWSITLDMEDMLFSSSVCVWEICYSLLLFVYGKSAVAKKTILPIQHHRQHVHATMM